MDYRGRGRFNRGGGFRGGRGGFSGRGRGGHGGTGERQIIPTKLHVSNLPEGCTSEDLEGLFGNYGKVVECSLIKDFAFVHYSEAEEAKQAVTNLDGQAWNGTLLAVKHSTSAGKQNSGGDFSENSRGRGGGGRGRFQRPTPYGDPYGGGGRGGFRKDFGGRNNFGGEGRGTRQINPTKLHVAGFPDSTTSQDLEELFENYGKVVECDIVKNFAFVHFRNADDADKAVQNLNGEDWRGSQLSVKHSTSIIRQKPGVAIGDCFVCGGRGHNASECPSELPGGRRGMGNPYEDPYAPSPKGLGARRGLGRPYEDPYADPYRRAMMLRDPYGDLADPYARLDPYRDPYRERDPLYSSLLDSITARDLALLRAARADPYGRPPPEFYTRRPAANGSASAQLARDGLASNVPAVEEPAAPAAIDDSYFYSDDYGGFSATM